MEDRIDWVKVNPDAYKGIIAASRSTGAIDRKLKELVDVRVSQMNGCAFCLDMHTRGAREAGETSERLDLLAAWREVPSFTPRERAALAWAEALTRIAETHAPDDLYEDLQAHFTEKEIVDLTLVIAIINTWNRTQIAMRRPPGSL
jgi:AhpD family alkylhydroperoxidase